MTEDQIEREVERLTNALDRRYLSSSSMTAAEYAVECRRINTWAETLRPSRPASTRAT